MMLVFFIGKRKRGRDCNRVARMYAHRIDIFNRADDNAVIVAYRVRLPSRTLSSRCRDSSIRTVGCRRDASNALARRFCLKSSLVVCNAAARTAKRERGTDDRGQADQTSKAFLTLLRNVCATSFTACAFETYLIAYTSLNFLRSSAFSMASCVEAPIKLNTQCTSRATPSSAHQVEQSSIQCRLTTHGRAAGHRDFSRSRMISNDCRPVNWLDIGRIGHFRIGHDRRRIRVHENDPETLFLEAPCRLAFQSSRIRRPAR